MVKEYKSKKKHVLLRKNQIQNLSDIDNFEFISAKSEFKNKFLLEKMSIWEAIHLLKVNRIRLEVQRKTKKKEFNYTKMRFSDIQISEQL